jgi:tRNA (guanosine-2'-O-)-methyltransferase
MEEPKKSKPSLRARADKIKDFRCKNLIAVIEEPDDIRNLGTIIRNVNALGVEKAYVVSSKNWLPADSTACRAGIPRDVGPGFHGMSGHRSTVSRAG